MVPISTNKEYSISSAEQVKLLTSPVRQEIVDSLAAAGPCTIRDLARALGMSADGLYYHLRLLLDAGLVVESGTRATARRDAVVYGLPAAGIRLDYEAGPEVRALIGDVVAAALRTTSRDFAAGLASDTALTRGPHRNLLGGRRKAWLTSSALERLNGLLEEVFELFESSEPGEDRELCSLTVVVSPIAPMPPRRESS